MCPWAIWAPAPKILFHPVTGLVRTTGLCYVTIELWMNTLGSLTAVPRTQGLDFLGSRDLRWSDQPRAQQQLARTLGSDELQSDLQQSFATSVTSDRTLRSRKPRGCPRLHRLEECGSSRWRSRRGRVQMWCCSSVRSYKQSKWVEVILLCMPAFTCNPLGAWAESLFVEFLELLRRYDGYLIV